MTTIAYKDGVIAYDSRLTADITIIDDDHNKHIESEGKHYFYSGATGQREAFIACDQGKDTKLKEGANALVIENGEVYCAGFNKDDGFFRNYVGKNKPYAIGSGTDHALTAMDLGCTAKEAVKMAVKRDTCTGGKIRTYKVK